MIETRDIAYSYDGKEFLSFPNISCKGNEILLLLGKSGVGKTTMLHLIGGLMKSTKGQVVIDGTDLNTLNQGEMDHFRGQHIGVIFQQAYFIRSISVLENMMLAQSLAGNKVDKEYCRSLLERLNIAYKADDSPDNLSQGEKQRLSIARAIVNKPSVILADEPTSALDDDNCNEVLELLEEQARDIGAALVIVTHDSRLKDRIDNHISLGSQ
jgi:putative ABC transport system ATP-binding protein